MRTIKWLGTIITFLIFSTTGFSQQLLLGKNPYALQKSAVLELNSDNQGLLFPRLADTASINLLSPPDGMVIFFTPSKQLMIRSNGYWQSITVTNALNNYWSINGNTNGVIRKFGTADNYDLPFITNNLERLRISAAGNVGIGNTSPAEKLDVSGNLRFSGALMPNGSAGTLGYVLTSSGAGAAPTWQDGNSFITSMSWLQNGNNLSGLKNFGTSSNFALPFITNNIERMRLSASGFLGVGTSSPSTVLHVAGINPLTLEGVQTGTSTSADSLLTITGGLVKKLPISTFQSPINGTGFVKASGTTISYDNNTYTVANAAITGGTKTKITFDSKGLVTGGADATTSDIAEGSNFYYTNSRAIAAPLTGLSTATATSVLATDNILSGIGKLQGQINALPTNATALLKANNLSDLASASIARTNLGATTVGSNFFTLTNPSAITFPRINADNTVSALDAATYRTAIGAGTGNGTVTSASVVSANGFAGTIASNTTTPAITLSTTVTGLLKGNGTAMSAATAGTDYVAPNAAIIGATKTKITYDSKGLVTAGADATTTDIAEGTNLYYTDARVRSAALTGLSTVTATAVTATDNVLAGVGKLQGQINNINTTGYLTGNQNITLSGDVTGSGTTAITTSIGANKVTLAHMAQVASSTFLGRTTAATGNVEALTTAQAKTMLGLTGNNSGDVVLAGQNYLSLSGQTITAGAIDLSGTHATGTLAAARFGALTGDVTNTAGSYATTIANGAVTYAKMQNLSGNNKLLGRATAGAGSAEEITIGSGLTLTGSTLSATAAANQWNTVGNSGINAATNFLGTIDDKPMILKSFNQPFLEFGNRGTLGLTQSYTDYTDPFEKVTHIRSAMQFEAPTASFYKPKMYIDANGNFRIKGSSAGTDYFEMGSTGTNNDGGFEFIIGDDGDEPIVFKSYHYINGMSEIMRLQSGRMAVGSNAFDATNPEKLLIDAGTTNSYNLMTGKGSIDNYLQINVQNRSGGASASSDLVATANNGSESDKFIDMGINSGGYTNTSYPILGGANTTYLYGTGNDMVIGNGTAAKNLRFFTGGFAAANERMRIDGDGSVAIGTTSFDAANPEQLLVDAGTTSSTNVISGKGSINSYLQLNIQNRSAGSSASSDVVATADNGTESVNFIDMGINSSTYPGTTAAGVLGGANNAYLYSTGNDFVFGNATAAKALRFFTGGTANTNERMRIDGSGNVGIGTVAASLTDKLTVAGVVAPSADNAYTLGRSGARWSAVHAVNGFIQTSDVRLKINIQSLNYGLKEVMAMKPVRYNWRSDPSANAKVGLIAQEVRKIIPEVVVGDETKENLGMNYAELVPVLVNAIKEQQKQIEDLKEQKKKDQEALKEVDELKMQMKELLDRVKKIEKR